MEDLYSDLAVDTGHGEAAPGCSPKGGMPHCCGENMEMKEVSGEQDYECDNDGCPPDDESCAPPDRRQIYQKSEGKGEDDDHGELRGNGNRQRHAEQNDAAPVPENHFARGVESMSDGDGGEDGTE